MKKLFDVPDSYKEHITKFDSSDGSLALGIIVTYFVAMTISGIIVQYISQLQITIICGEINVFWCQNISLLDDKYRVSSIMAIAAGNLSI